jgi:hypothetical protein
VIRERETERLTQVEAMREQVTKFIGARAQGENAGLMRVKLALNDMLEKFMKDVDKDEEDGLAPDMVETWKGQVYAAVKEAVEFFQNTSAKENQPLSRKIAWPPSGRPLGLRPNSRRP